MSHFRHTFFFNFLGGGTPNSQCFRPPRGKKTKFSQNSPKYGLVSEKTKKMFCQLFRNMGGLVRPKLTNVNFFLSFFLKASLRAPEKRNLNDTLYPLPCQHKLLSSKSVSYFSPKIYLWQYTKIVNSQKGKSDLSYSTVRLFEARYIFFCWLECGSWWAGLCTIYPCHPQPTYFWNKCWLLMLKAKSSLFLLLLSSLMVFQD